MAAIKKFFENKRVQAKFKLAGKGQKLSDDSASTSRQQSPRNQASSNTPRSRVATEESKRAGAAALARFDHLQNQMPTMANRSHQVIRAEALKELAAERAARESMKTQDSSIPEQVNQDSAPVLTVSGVYFKCALVSPDLLSKKEMQERIREFLYQQLSEDEEVTPCYMIHTLNHKERVKNCIETVSKYLQNIFDNPEEVKYQKIRLQNRVFQDRVAGIKGAHEFLLAAGFELKQMKPTEDAELEDFYVFNPDKLPDARRMLDILQTTEPIVPELDRNMKILMANDELSPGRIELPLDFFNITADDVKREQKLKSNQVEKEITLRTKAMREREEKREYRHYRYTLLRIRFPDGIILQGTFSVHENFSNVQDFVREYLVNDWQPFILSTGTGTRLENADSTLLSLQLIPAAVIHFAWDPEVARDLKRETGLDSDQFLNDEVLTMIEDLAVTS